MDMAYFSYIVHVVCKLHRNKLIKWSALVLKEGSNILENDDPEQNLQQENNQSNSTIDGLGSADPSDVIEVLVEMGKFVVNTSKEVFSSIADNIDISL